MVGLKCIQNISTMAEPHNSLQGSGKKDILSAALGQSGLLFTQRVEDDVQDVFAALAEDADYPSENKSQNLRVDPIAGKFKADESFENDLDDLMDLISNDTGPFTQPKQDIAWPTSDIAILPHGGSTSQSSTVQPTSSKFRLDSILNDLKNNTVPQSTANRSSVVSANALKTEPTSIFSSTISADFGTVHLPGLKSVIEEQSNRDIMGFQFAGNINNAKVSPGVVLSPPVALSPAVVSADDDEEVDEEEEEELGYADTFADYMPAKVKVGKPHPDSVVETSSMASVPPPDVWYTLSLPPEVPERRYLSALQLEAVIYACQQHEHFLPNGKRAGFLIGDGAGVGKGRTVAGIIYENYLCGRKRAIWLSVSNDLRLDAIRDLQDIGCSASVHALNKFKYDEKITSRLNGKVKKGVIFSTYSSLIGETQGKARFKTRLSQLMHWCGDDFDGVIILDECHKAKNLVPTGSGKPTKTGITVLQLQDLLPKARVVYCSATGASEPKNMAYMNRLGIWGSGTPFPEFNDFIQSVEKRGVGAMELVAMDMKLRGMYIARQLSFAGTSFDVREVTLSDDFVDMYNASVKLWSEAREKMEKAAEMLSLDGQIKKRIWGQFWSAHQRFFKYLCIAAKVQEAVAISREAVKQGKCVVIGLQSTGEARTQELFDDFAGEINDFVSTAKSVFSNLIEKHFPVSGARFTTRCNSEINLESINSNSDSPRRRRDWRDLTSRKRKADKIETIELSDSDDEGSQNTSFSEIINSDAGSNDDDDDDDVARSESGSNSETDEESWLKAFSDEPTPKKKKKKKKSDKGNHFDDGLSVLDAAGFTGRQFSWTKTLSSSSHPAKAGHIHRSSTFQNLTRQVSTASNISSSLSAAEQCLRMKRDLLSKLDIVAPHLPPNTLDELIDKLGGPSQVAEMTGRKNRVLIRDDGTFAYESRSKDDVPLEVLNITEKERFLSGEKLIAIISEAASSGISLQADRRVKNQRKRLHITLELPWSADKAIQQFGRTHRSNQVSAPEYLFLISELAGERRFASIVAKRLESLGALTHGDRRATESRDLSRFNFDTKYGRSALEVTLKSLVGAEKPLVPFPTDYEGVFLEDAQEGLLGVGMVARGSLNSFILSEKDHSKVSRFLNRILGLKVGCQNALFNYFIETMNSITKEAKRSGRWDEGILDLGSQGESVKKISVKTFFCKSTSGQVATELITVSVERGMPWHRAYDIFLSCMHSEEGFYETATTRMGKKIAVLVKRSPVTSKKKLYTLYRSNIGLQPKQEQLQDIERKYTKISYVEAEHLWKDQYDFSKDNCTHSYWQGKCKKKTLGLDCEVGMRKRTCYVLAGSVLSVWSKLEAILSTQVGSSTKMQIIRLKLDDGNKIVGVMIPSNLVQVLTRTLSGTQNDPFSILNLL